MKKFAAIALAAVLLCALTALACAEGTFRVGVKQDVYGFGYLDETTGIYEGMEIDLGAMIAEALGYDDVEYTTVTAATRGQMLDNDELDCVIATFTIKPERKESWDFSTPYYTDAVTVLVENASGIADLAGLAGKTVGVSTGSTSAKALATAMADAGVIAAFDADKFEIATFDGGVKFKEFDDYPAISLALDAGDVDAFCVDKSILANYKTDDRSFIADSFAPQDYGVATKKGSELSAKVEELITGWLADGTIAELVTKWGLD
ncbi:MAG: transporter substrate-binding domain-containing protein [Clostridiales bacterium]|nr:transporter substrate-binding domain-containing protein [Clostridiales bacterium]